MDDLTRFWQELVARPGGPMAFRFYLQPVMATIYAVISGLQDAKAGKPPYSWALFHDHDPVHRRAMLRDGWKSVRNVFLLAIGMDLAYQYTVLKAFRPIEALVVGVVLAIVPYLLVRGPVDRLARRRN